MVFQNSEHYLKIEIWISLKHFVRFHFFVAIEVDWFSMIFLIVRRQVHSNRFHFRSKNIIRIAHTLKADNKSVFAFAKMKCNLCSILDTELCEMNEASPHSDLTLNVLNIVELLILKWFYSPFINAEWMNRLSDCSFLLW